MPSLSKKIGIIAEDKSDVESLKIIISKIQAGNVIAYESFVGKGCGKIKRKCQGWADILKIKGCKTLVLVHDLDRNNYKELLSDLQKSLGICPIANYIISIPIEEIEAWLLADIESVRKYFNIKAVLKINGAPENISSPKEKIEQLVRLRSNKTKQYINSEHNQKIFVTANLATIAVKCSSFRILRDFIKKV
jgi:hypothetical protein